MVFEPLWTLVTSNKAIPARRASRFSPQSRVPAQIQAYELTEWHCPDRLCGPSRLSGDGARTSDRETANEVFVAGNRRPVRGYRDQIFRELFHMPASTGHNVPDRNFFEVNGDL